MNLQADPLGVQGCPKRDAHVVWELVTLVEGGRFGSKNGWEADAGDPPSPRRAHPCLLASIPDLPCLHLPPIHLPHCLTTRVPLATDFPHHMDSLCPRQPSPRWPVSRGRRRGRPRSSRWCLWAECWHCHRHTPGCDAQLSRCAGPTWARTGQGVQDTARSRSSGSSPYPSSPHLHLAFFSPDISKTMPRSPLPSSSSISSVSSFPKCPWHSTWLLSQPSVFLKPFLRTQHSSSQEYPKTSDFPLMTSSVPYIWPCDHTLLESLSKENHGSHTLAIHGKVTLSFIWSKL